MDIEGFVDVLVKRWPVGVAVALASVVIGALIGVTLPPIYEAQALILVSRPPVQVGTPPDPTGPGLKIGEVLSQDLPAAAVVEFANSDGVIRTLTEDLQPPREIRERLVARLVPGTNLVELVVRGRDPKQTAVLGNAWARVVDAAGDAILQADANATHDFFATQVQDAAANLAGAQKALRDFDVTTPLGLLQARVNVITGQISNYESRLTDLGVSLRSQTATLAGINGQLLGQPKTLTLTKPVITDPFLMQAASEVTRHGVLESSTLALKSQELNPVYLQLDQARADAEIRILASQEEGAAIRQTISQLRDEIGGLRARLADGQLRRAALAGAANTASQTYSVLVERRNETHVASVVRGKSVRAIVDAVAPRAPVAPKKHVILVLSSLFGCMLGVLSMLVVEYSVTPRPRVTTVPGALKAEPRLET
ncbi:MAG TPA: GNVR domain-containing protein [bacterium]|nr:GNVR domain-containing protein [bacterium]